MGIKGNREKSILVSFRCVHTLGIDNQSMDVIAEMLLNVGWRKSQPGGWRQHVITYYQLGLGTISKTLLKNLVLVRVWGW